MLQLLRKRGNSSGSEQESTDTTEVTDTTEESSTSKKPKRQLTVATFEKWQRNYEREYQSLTWLRCTTIKEDSTMVQNLFCDICKRYEDHLQGMRNYSSIWITGSRNLKASNLIDHAKSDQHKAAMRRLAVDNAKAANQSVATYAPIARSFLRLEESVKTKMKLKFDICYLMAKEGMAFEKYPSLHQLESRHGVSIGSNYATPQSAKLFTHYIALAQRESFFTQISASKFYSFLMDGSTDAGNLEQESIIILFCQKDDSTRKLKSCMRFLSMATPERADADGLLKCLSQSLEPLGIDDVLNKENVIGVSGKPVLVGGGTDGASVNVAENSGMKGKIQTALPWITWSWCYAHRLELACKNALTSTVFKDVEEMLLRLYYIYERSPKKSRDLIGVIEDLRQVFEFPKGGDMPVRAHGSRWITHKRKALLRVIDRYGAYLTHLTSLSEDTSIKSDDRARIKGYLQKWVQYRYILGCALYADILKPASILSLCLQDTELDVVAGIKSILKSSTALKNLAKTEPMQWATVKLVEDRIRSSEDKKSYQGVSLRNCDITTQQSSIRHALVDLNNLDAKMRERLEWSDVNLLRSLLAFTETQNWAARVDAGDNDEDHSMDEVLRATEFLTSHFRIPLESKEVALDAIHDEVEDVVHYARRYFAINQLDYCEAWYTLLTCPDSRKWPNIASLCELAFSLPFSNGRVEQIFSTMKTIKTERRTSLNEETLRDLVEIFVEGPPLSLYSADRAIELWWTDCNTTRRVNQTLPRKEYRPRASSSASQKETTDDRDRQPESHSTLQDWDQWFSDNTDDTVVIID